MNLEQAIKARHSVREFSSTFLSQSIVDTFNAEIAKINAENDLHIQFINGDPDAFTSSKVKYGSFKNVMNYFALVGKKDDKLEEKMGYYGEYLVLKAQQLGCNTCWIGMKTNKVYKKIQRADDEKLVCIIAVGYGITQGKPHKQKACEKICPSYQEQPDWFKRGIDFVILAPSALNQMKTKFDFVDAKVVAKAGIGFFTKVDLGIAKYHFETGAGSHNINWLD